MLKQERQNIIIQQLNLHNRVQSAELCRRLQVSEDTVRRDLQELADEGRLVKVHGGALSSAFHTTLKTVPLYSENEKQTIGAKTVSLLSDGMVVLMSGGTTMRAVIQALPIQLRATFITPSLPVAMQLLEHPNIETILIGSRLSREAQMSIGAQVVRALEGIRADLLILGTNAVDATQGITDSDWEVVQVKRAMMKSAAQVAALSISEKLNTAQSYVVCKPSEFQVLITELPPTTTMLDPFHQQGLRIL